MRTWKLFCVSRLSYPFSYLGKNRCPLKIQQYKLPVVKCVKCWLNMD